MLRLLRRLRRTAAVVLGLLGGIWSVLMMLLMAGSLALSVAMTMVPAVFSAVAGVVESVTGVRSLATRQADDLARLERRAARLSGELADSRAAQARLARELRDSPVTYRGKRIAAREAVKDTAERVARRTTFATSRNLASMAGEALPMIGVGVIVAATAWELSDACALMGEMRELDAAFNPNDPVTDDEICGMKPPTRAELWASIKASPGAAWDTARGMYDSLPEVSFSGTYASTVAYLAGRWDAVFGDDPDPAEALP
ncbi:hypothetical protein [Paracoccus sp. SJTW-4]|uniref:hypothetical protein n=1 Tax=Paracoccus sp. SJTW-4 TaxID=3078428 RepID=UPI0039EC7806